jgi:DNA-binding MarR family transcriptional regulator
MITSGTMTRQLQQLEASGLVSRLANPRDARSMLVQLTAAGLELIDRAVTAHVQNEARILAPIAAAELAQLDARLSELLAVLEPAVECFPASQANTSSIIKLKKQQNLKVKCS